MQYMRSQSRLLTNWITAARLQTAAEEWRLEVRGVHAMLQFVGVCFRIYIQIYF